ncbi:hypothetical protein DINM_006823 [Dirofilaria immitis]|nr:hypothetical protein [Dirofilaria immitis]
MAEKGKEDRQLAWIYEGTKSLVNREDYLLGKRVDKNFELYSDTVVKEKESGIEAIKNLSDEGGKNLAGEDGKSFGAIKNAETDEKSDRKKEKKRLKKLKKLERKERKRRHSATCNNDVDYIEKNKKHLTDNEKHATTSSLSSKPIKSSSSESDNNEDEDKEDCNKLRKEQYGLIKTQKDELRKREEKSERRKLTEEEMEIRRKEMLENADWRDKVRTKNIRRNALRDEEENRRNEGKTANFIRPMLNNAASTLTVEQQLKSHRSGLQRTSGFTEPKFVKR